MKTILKHLRQYKAWKKKRNQLALARAKAQITDLTCVLRYRDKQIESLCRQRDHYRAAVNRIDYALQCLPGEADKAGKWKD